MQEFEKYKELASIIEWFANNVPCPGTPWNKLLHEINTALALPDEQGDAIPADLEQRAKAWVKQHESWVPDEQSEGAMFNAYLAGAQSVGGDVETFKDAMVERNEAYNKLQSVVNGLVHQLRAKNPYDNSALTPHVAWQIVWNQCCDKLQELIATSPSQPGSQEGDATCVFCEMPCEPAPTNRGWSSVRYGKGLHFDCAGKVVDQGNIIAMKELDELGKDPTT